MRLLRACTQAFAVLRRLSPQLVIGMGGFASGPGGLAAWLQRRPLLIHEQNAAAGLTNRALAWLAGTVLQAFPDTFAPRHRATTVGNPVRDDILQLPAPAQRWRGRSDAVRLLVLGGSGGALAINQRVPAALARMSPAQRPQVRHQAGRTLAQAEAAYAEHAVKAEVTAFIDDMAQAYAWADVVVCRSGALTVAELAAAGLSALLVPFPHAVDDHQSANAAWLVNVGGASMIRQSELDVERLATELQTLCSDREALLARAEAARTAAWPQATTAIADACQAALGWVR